MLDPRLVALQGLGFPLSPIAIAVQGLIEQIQEEARDDDTIGGGRRRGSRLAWLFGGPASKPKAQPGKVGADVSEAEVRAQWELLEARQAAQQPKGQPRDVVLPAKVYVGPAAVEAPKPFVHPVAKPTPPVVTQDDDDEALLMILAQL